LPGTGKTTECKVPAIPNGKSDKTTVDEETKTDPLTVDHAPKEKFEDKDNWKAN
jgi:hypothetical protein